MTRRLFILGSTNADDGSLSAIALCRIETALAEQRANRDVVLLATGGFGPLFNRSPITHRELVYRHLEAVAAVIDRAQPGNLLSANTVEDIVLINAFATAHDISAYGIVTSTFHAARCRFILDCLSPERGVDIVVAPDPDCLRPDIVAHEARAIAQLILQNGVLVGGILFPRRERQVSGV